MSGRRRLLLATVLLAAAAAVLVSRPRPSGAGGFAAPATCFSCHAQQHREWTGSHHDLAMQEATAETVLGDFDGATLGTARFFRRDGGFFAHVEGADHEVRYAFGVEPLQQYLVELDGGRLQALTIAWDTTRKRWFDLQPGESVPSGDPLHWAGPLYNWNRQCAECHSTGLEKNYDAGSRTYETTWHEIDVGCQGCHGPGARHVAWAQQAGEDHDAGEPGGLEVRLDGDAQVEACARCHARRSVVNGDYRYGARLLDHYRPALLEEGLYHADGQILDEVYVYGSFLQSRMHSHGVRCTDCHDPHTARLKLPAGNDACVYCHKPRPPPRFETLASKEYDGKEHHFHEPPIRCVDCHMRAKTYMVVDPRRDHSFRVPRPDLTVKIGVPNACNDCHEDETPRWAAAAVERWYPGSERPAHFGEALAAGRASRPEAGAALMELAADGEQPDIARATALDLLRRYRGEEVLAAMSAALEGRDPLVRGVAAAGVGAVLPPARARVVLLAPLLEDAVRSVRIEAARALAAVPPRMLDGAQREALDAALEEFEQRQRAIADRPEAHLNLGAMHDDRGDRGLAERAYNEALRIDPGFSPARFNLANLYNAMGRNREAEAQLREILERDPHNGEAQYSLGLLLAELERMEEAAGFLAGAARRLDRARVHYNHGLALRRLGRDDDAGKALLRAAAKDPADPQVVHALALLYTERREWKRAETWAGRLADLAPEAARELLARIRAR